VASLLQAMIDLEIREESPHGYIGAIVGLMRDHKVTFYDAAYHALDTSHRSLYVCLRHRVAAGRMR
jgi:hypothetical protein